MKAFFPFLQGLMVWLMAVAVPACDNGETTDGPRQQPTHVDAASQTTAPAVAEPSQTMRPKEDARRALQGGGLVVDPRSVDVALPMECRGQEPSWHMSLTEQAITLRRLGEPTLVFEPTSFRTSGGIFVLQTTSKEGHSLRLVLVDEACSDPMDGTNYPYSVKIVVDGQAYLGCARPLR